MTLEEFRASADALVGQKVTVEGGWLTSDTVNLWLADRLHSEQALVVVEAPRIAEWLTRHIPPRVGGVCAYCHEARVTGTVRPRDPEGVPVLGGDVYAVVQHAGQLHIRSDEA